MLSSTAAPSGSSLSRASRKAEEGGPRVLRMVAGGERISKARSIIRSHFATRASSCTAHTSMAMATIRTCTKPTFHTTCRRFGGATLRACRARRACRLSSASGAACGRRILGMAECTSRRARGRRSSPTSSLTTGLATFIGRSMRTPSARDRSSTTTLARLRASCKCSAARQLRS